MLTYTPSFVYGGFNSVTVGDIYALSLPGFVWTRVYEDEPRAQRANHACVVAGESQLISLGGLVYTGDRVWEWSSKDSFPRGIGIFDMNSLQWKDRYVPEQGYRTHKSIRAWYDDE